MFRTGDMIIYGGTGVCRVTEIEERELPDGTGSRPCYKLQPLYQSCTIYTPAEGGKVFMRPIITSEEAERLIDMIPSIEAEAYQSRVQREIVEHYEAAFQTHDCGDLIELTMSIYAKRKLMQSQNRKFGAVDERFMKRAEDMLFGEMAAALGMSREKVPDYIASRVAGARRQNADR